MMYFTKPLTLFIIWISMLMHPVHVSISRVDYSSSEKKMDISFKFFTDDFRLLFFHLYQLNIDFSDSGNYEKYHPKIDQYIKSHFVITEGKNQYNLLYDSLKRDNTNLWFYYHVNNLNPVDSVKILNVILMDLYMDQKNLMLFKSDKNEEGYRFDYNTTEQVIKME